MHLWKSEALESGGGGGAMFKEDKREDPDQEREGKTFQSGKINGKNDREMTSLLSSNSV